MFCYFTQSSPDLRQENVGSHVSHISIFKEHDAPDILRCVQSAFR